MRYDCWNEFKKFLLNYKGIKEAENLFLYRSGAEPIPENIFLQDLVNNGFSVARGNMFLKRILNEDSKRLVGLLLSNRELDVLHVVGIHVDREDQILIANYEALIPWSIYWNDKISKQVEKGTLLLRYLIYW